MLFHVTKFVTEMNQTPHSVDSKLQTFKSQYQELGQSWMLLWKQQSPKPAGFASLPVRNRKLYNIVKPRIEVPRFYISTTCLEPRPVSRTRHLCGTRLLSNQFKVVNFCGRCIRIRQLLHKLDVARNNSNCFSKIFNACFVTYKWRLADFQKAF